MQRLVVIPTYNELKNIEALIAAIRQQVEIDILVVDDNSPDGTGALIEQLSKKYSGLFLLSRDKKSGLGRAYIAGFRWALGRSYDTIFEMDADFSHRPQDLVALIKASEISDFVVGSRYVSGGKVSNWTFLRRLISRGGSWYSRLVLGIPIRDCTGGFNGWSQKVLNAIDLGTVQSEGYSFQIELKYRALKKGFSYTEVPIVFDERREGQSKMSFKIFIEAFYRIWLLRWL